MLTKTKKASLSDLKKDNSPWDTLDVPIEHRGRAITLPGDPSDMPLDKAIEALERKRDDEEQPFNVHETIDAYPQDGAVAFVKAMKELYGWASPQTVMTFFGPKPPEMLSVKVGPGDAEVIQCPIGAFKLPGIENLVNTHLDYNGFIIYGEVKKKERHILLELATVTRRIVREQSIYRGKPIRLSVDSDGDLMLHVPPQFLSVNDISEASLVFDADIQAQIDTNILVPLKQTALCRKYGIPLKRGILLAGPYGTGKSLTARLAARVAQQNGWTFILLDKVQGLRVALEFANRYAPAVVFAEDIDRMAEERDDATNDLINVIDGVVSKSSEIMTVLTTNFVEKLNPVILRPGRLDAVITLRAPGPETVKKLVAYYAGDLLPADANLNRTAEEMKGQIPASIRECVERAKLGMIGRNDTKLADSDFVTAAQTMKNHLALLNREVKETSPAETLATSLRAVVNGHDEAIDAIHSGIKQIVGHTDTIDDIQKQVHRIKRRVC